MFIRGYSIPTTSMWPDGARLGGSSEGLEKLLPPTECIWAWSGRRVGQVPGGFASKLHASRISGGECGTQILSYDRAHQVV
jgi:hypothetical protein